MQYAGGLQEKMVRFGSIAQGWDVNLERSPLGLSLPAPLRLAVTTFHFRTTPVITKISGQLTHVAEESATVAHEPFEYQVFIPDFTPRQLQSQAGREQDVH